MEEYLATDQRPVAKCLEDVGNADIYVGVFAFRYGYVPPNHHQNPKGRSITELEYRKAENLKKTCLTFVVKDTTPWLRTFDDAYAADKGDRIKTLRQHLLTEKMASALSNPYELASLVQTSITKYLEKRKQANSSTPQVSEAPPPRYLEYPKTRVALSGPAAFYGGLCPGVLWSGVGSGGRCWIV